MSDLIDLLEKASKAYYNGAPFLSDEHYDALEALAERIDIGTPIVTGCKHLYKMYSLRKLFDSSHDLDGEVVETPKLDGAAVAHYYDKDGNYYLSATRGNGETGEDCTLAILALNAVPLKIEAGNKPRQITGEMVCPKDTPNARNLASGTLKLKNVEEVVGRPVKFVAYGLQPGRVTYEEDLRTLRDYGFTTVDSPNLRELYPCDGTVVRLNDNAAFIMAGHTAKHPRGAVALKKSSDVSVVKTILREVVWQAGAHKVTPVAIFDEVDIDGAKVSRATLHNPGFIEQWDIDIGDTLYVTRSGGIIPKVVAVTNEATD